MAETVARLSDKDAEVSRLLSETSAAGDARRSLESEKSKLQAAVEAREAEIRQLKGVAEGESAARIKLEKVLDDLRTTMGSDEARRSQAAKSMEQEITSLRGEVSKLESDLSSATTKATDAVAQATAKFTALHTEHSSLSDKHRETTESLDNAIKARAAVDKSLLESANALRLSTSELSSARTQLASTSKTLSAAEAAKEVSLFSSLKFSLPRR